MEDQDWAGLEKTSELEKFFFLMCSLRMTLLVPLRFTALAVKGFFEPHHCAVLQSITTSSVVIVGITHPEGTMSDYGTFPPSFIAR